MATKPAETGKLELAVKMDYSETYRENEKLDLDLDHHLVEIVRSQHRFLTDKEDELELAKVEAERRLKLKEAVKIRQENGDGLGVDGYGRPPRRARSRMELEKLCRLNIDPFEDISQRPEGWVPTGDPRQDMLESMRTRSGQIQTRVSAFLKELENFNKRDQKSRLEHILETTG
nr:hypothetical protein BaRGS_021475 [Batillaria attramentaria]